jgi:hypothetical protein
MKDHYLCLSDSDFADAAEADLASQIPHADDHAKPTVKGGLGRSLTDNSIGKTF